MAKQRKAVLKKGLSQFNQIHGGYQGSTTLENVTSVLLLAIMMIPLLLIGGFLISKAMEMFAQHPDAWIIPLMSVAFGMFFVGLWFYVIWWAIWVPSVTCSSFVLQGERLEIRTRKHGAIAIRVGDIFTCKKRLAERSLFGGERILGWWLRSKTIGWVYLSETTSNSSVLISRIPAANST